MKKYLVTVFLIAIFQSLSLASTQYKKVVVISDVDDTIKISNVRDKLDMLAYASYSDSLFYGMEQVYRSLQQELNAQFFYVSNGWPPATRAIHEDLLERFHFPKGEYLGRDNPFNKQHKLTSIRNIIHEQNPTTVILIGDNGERDPLYYHQIQKEFKNSEIAFHTFIHKVYNKPTEEIMDAIYENDQSFDAEAFKEQNLFLSAAELSKLLFQQRLVSTQSNLKIEKHVTKRVLNEKPNSVFGPLVYPYFHTNEVPHEILRSCKKVLTP